MKTIYRIPKQKDEGYIFFDFDDFMFETSHLHIRFFSDVFGVRCSPYDLAKKQNMFELISQNLTNPTTFEEFWLVYHNQFLNSYQYHEDIKIKQDANIFIPILAQKYRIVIVTNRADISKNVIEFVLEKHIPQCIDSIHFVHQGLRKTLGKQEFIAQHSMDGLPKLCFFDDHVREVESVGKVIPSFLFDPYGWHDFPQEKTVRNFSEVFEIIQSL